MTRPKTLVGAVRASLRWARRNWLLVAAGVLTGGEGLVALGVPLPGSTLVPIEWRAPFIGLVGGLGFVFRLLAQRREERGR